MPSLRAPLADLIVRGEHAVHRARRAGIRAFVEERGGAGGRRTVRQARFVEHGEDARSLHRRQRAR